MGKAKHLENIKSLFDKSPVVSFKSIERVIGKKKSSNYAKLLVNNLVKKNRITSLAKGFYTKHNEIGLAVFCFKPAYIGLQAALSRHGIWEQETVPVIITTKNARVGARKIGENNILIRKINKKYFFGWSYEKDGEFYLPYSDLEKTLIDMAVFRQKVSPETAENIRKIIDMAKLRKYLRSYSKKTQERISLMMP